MPPRSLKSVGLAPLRWWLRVTARLRELARRGYAHAALAAQLITSLPTSVVVLGRCSVFGTGRIHIGAHALLYPDLHLETQGQSEIVMGDSVVLSRGVHLVAMAGISIGPGCMIGEYASLRDANHTRLENIPLRDAGHTAKPITLGREVWIGRGVTVLGGVTIGDGATVGANAVVTKDIPAGGIYGGIPAVPLGRR
jgi:acetyltransferase-like isoleucine patch superfamily enzyme